MNPILKNIIAVVIALAVGMTLNMLLIENSSSIIALPEGVDPNDFKSIKGAIADGRFSAINYVVPFLAHASQAFFGALICTKLAASNHFKLAMIIGFVS